MKWYRIFIIIMIVGILGSLIFVGPAIMVFDCPSTVTYEGLKIALYSGFLFPGIIVADIIFYVLMRKYNTIYIGMAAFVIPVIVMLFISGYLRYGNLSYQYLPEIDSRHFRETPAFNLVDNIIKGKSCDIVTKEELECNNYNGMTPLLYFIHNSQYEKAHILLSLGADPNKVNNKTQISPLCELIQTRDDESSDVSERIKLLVVLVNKGADVNYIFNNKSPLMYLCSHPKIGKEIVALLIKSGANVNYQYRQEDSYLHESYKENESALNLAVYSGNYDVALALIEQGADTIGYRDWMLDQLTRNRSNSKIVVNRDIETQLVSFLKSCKK